MRKSFFIKPALQAKYIAISLLIVVLTTLTVYFVVQRQIYSSEMTSNLLVEEVNELRREIRNIIVPIACVLLLAIGIQSLLFFHRLLGPIYVFETIIKMMSEGKIGGHIRLRKNDELKDLGLELEKMAAALCLTVKKDRGEIAGISAELEELKKSNPRLQDKINEILSRLGNITQGFKIQQIPPSADGE